MVPSLYVHIPFCSAKCDYCDFFSVGGTKSISDDYLNALLSEAKHYARLHEIAQWKTVYIGGGTPSILTSIQIRTLLKSLREIAPFAPGAEITMEMNPESITDEKLIAAQESGVNRLSVGIQSVNQNALEAIHRHCSAWDIRCAMEKIREVWKGDLNLDVIAGLPNQSEDEFKKCLESVVSYNPDHISMYTLTVEEETPLFRRIEEKEIQFDEDEADRQWLMGRDFLKSRGYFQYEVSNFAKPGHESRHNMTYWKLEDYIGIGAGASGTVYGPVGRRWTNTCVIDDYIKNRTCEEERLDLETQEFEFFMMGFRMLSGVNSNAYSQRFNSVHSDISSRLGKIWQDFKSEGLCTETECADGSVQYALNEKGILFLNRFLVELCAD